MIILPNNKEDENLDGVKSPSSYLKAKSLEKKNIDKSFKHLTIFDKRNDIMEDRLDIGKNINEYDKYLYLNEIKRQNDNYKFNKYLEKLVTPFKRLEFQKYVNELESLDNFYFLVIKKQFNKYTLSSLSASLLQIEKHCIKIKEKLNQSKIKIKENKKENGSLFLGAKSSTEYVTADNLLKEFSIIAEECHYLNNLANKDYDTQSLFPLENDSEKSLLTYFIMTSIKLFECLDTKGLTDEKIKQEQQSFVWETILLTNSLKETSYSTFRKNLSLTKNKSYHFFNLVNCATQDHYFKIKEEILNF